MIAALLTIPAGVLPLAPSDPATSPFGPREVEGECVDDAEGQTCTYRFSTIEAPFENFTMKVPVLGRSLATVSVAVSGADACWHYEVYRGDTVLTWMSDRLPGHGTPQGLFARDVNEHLILSEAVEDLDLVFFPNVCDYYLTWQEKPPTPANFVVQWSARLLPEGVTPDRPAATKEDPHVLDKEGDGPPGGDITELWLDDAKLHDGSFELHLGISRLRELADWAHFNGNFDVKGSNFHPYVVIVNDSGRVRLAYCGLMIRSGNGDAGSQSTMSQLPAPPCEIDVDRGVATMHLLESAVANPGPDDMFTELEAFTRRCSPFTERALMSGRICEDTRTQTDTTEKARYDFALGGPDVWDELNPRIQRQSSEPDPWYTHPFAAANVADTLQIAGAALAGGTFLFGLVLVQRRRKRAHGLLAEIEAVVREHRHDAARGLIALGDLEEVIDARLKARKITESEYQIASQRIATAATRLSMRRDLGLDDGAPGGPPDHPLARKETQR